MQGWCTVEHHWVLGNSLFQHIPHLGTLTLHHALCRLDVLRIALLHQTLHHEWLEQLQRHQLWQTTLVQLQLRTNDNHGTTGVIHALTQQVLTETALLALEQVRQRLQRAVARSGDWATTSTIVE